MTTAAQVIAVGERYVGVKESPSGSNKQQFGIWYGMNGVPWCAIFASYCLYVAGYRWSGATTAKGFSYCPSIVNWGKAHGRISRTPHLGDLAVAINNQGVPHHVELVRRVLPGSQFEGLGGNTGPANLSNGGEVMIHSHSDGTWVFVSPYYTAPSPAPAPSPSAPVSKHHITRNIGLTTPYTTGADVKWAQQRLVALGIPVGVDGVFGPRMHNAVVLFQRRVGIHADGVLGPVTGDHLQSGK